MKTRKNKLFSIVLVLVLAFCMLMPQTLAVKTYAAEDGASETWPFKDIQEQPGDWIFDSAKYVYDKGIMTGLNKDTFGPAELLSRAQFAVILHRMEGEPKAAYKNTFPDIPDGTWYTTAVLWANSAGVVKGYENGYFGPADSITREQMVVMMYRYAGYLGLDLSNSGGSLSAFPDASKVSYWAKDAMEWAIGTGIITGDGGKLNPQGNVSRAVCAAIIKRFCEKYPEDVFIDPVKDWGLYDSLITQIKAETDMARRAELMHEAEDILMSTYGIVPLLYYVDHYMQKPYVSGVYADHYSSKLFANAKMGNGSDTLNVNLGEGEPECLDPAFCISDSDCTLVTNSFSGLYAFDKDGNTIPACADSYTVSEDGKVYTVSLKSGLKWSDGSVLTAEDFVYSWKRAADPANEAEYRYLFSIFDGYDTQSGINVEAIDETTLRFVLSAPFPFMEELLASCNYYPVKKDAADSNPEGWWQEAGFVGNGAFQCTGWEHNGTITLEKNPYYWDAANVSIEKIIVSLDDDLDAVYAAYNQGNLDLIVYVPEDQVQALIESHNPDVQTIQNLGTHYLAFSMKSKLFEGKTAAQAAYMRMAISMLIDRENILDKCAFGQTVASSFIPQGMKDGNGGIFNRGLEDGYFDPYAINTDREGTIQKAITLLKKAGYAFNEDGKLSSATPITIDYYTNDGHYVTIAELIQKDLSAVGIDVSIRVENDWDKFTEGLEKGNFDIASEGYVADYNDPICMLALFTTDSDVNDPQFGR